ncbi:hypothetical protein MPHL43072_24115 [Mycolicibacterium phlei DSM 43072]|uniref:Secreted protein n=2 Tax=Mycolicibacterium phlei TaxID=1771 RepID=A0A5N5UXM2_MYCPH|nr:hypothetical protein MPHLCCUG_02641 [Mycolicibacterium phlei]KAB7754343.1 hypothetical protein MPHL21000_16780 [Mycolicibacterium phlei DSM 43239 = CCUG 21000]KXW66684.1 hypothetical protein MPHL43070_20930 [Mycolicibacterium phlei DSM 43070]KXW66823.1 hypothetical protein MPHL43072_24115 [Mycolicibacterium phlei DSM 43072]VEG09566.1 putative secreted protein [Mycobacteroides chelonae]
MSGKKKTMNTRGLALCAGAVAVTGMVAATPAQAADDWGLNGTYIATSNGDFANINHVLHPLPSLRSTWTISTTCSYPTECTGTVHSEFGWTETIYKKGGVWWVKHRIPDWVPCEDGTAAPGLQEFRFVPVNEDGSRVDESSTTLAGEDRTTGESGACGINRPVFITMPFKLVKVG